MFARSLALGTLSAMALALTTEHSPRFALATTGAVTLDAAGGDARYGMISTDGRGSLLSISLGATGPGSALQLVVPGGRLPAPGRYAIRPSTDDRNAVGIQASLSAGPMGHPLGWFHGESGTVTITRAENGRIAGAFDIRARGFLDADAAEEDRWVTVTGTFDAAQDSAGAVLTASR
jgi:hypothetical protein